MAARMSPSSRNSLTSDEGRYTSCFGSHPTTPPSDLHLNSVRGATQDEDALLPEEETEA